MTNRDPDRAAPRPSLSEQARSLITSERCGTLSTHSLAQPGFPFASLAPYASDTSGRPIFLLSGLAQHTKNLQADDRACLLVSRRGADGGALSGPRTTLLGRVQPTEGAPDTRDLYLDRHPDSARWIDFGDFALFRMEIERVYHVAGFASMGWLSGTAFGNASVDPLVSVADDIQAHMNEDHAEALVLLAEHYGGFAAERAAMHAVDRLGFDIYAQRGSEGRTLRISFPQGVHTADETRDALVQMVRDARRARHA